MSSSPEYTAWAGLLYVHATLLRQLDAEMQARHKMPLSTYEVLLFLAQAPNQELRMFDLAQNVVLSLSGMSRLVDRLERDSLVCRRRAIEDMRGSYVVLTEQGSARFAEAQATHRDGVRRLFLSRLTADDLLALGDLWERILPGTSEALQRPQAHNS